MGTSIQNNTLLRPTDKYIKPYQCSIIVTEGPILKGKINLEGLQIAYESFYTSQLTLNTLAKNQPLYYGFLGKDITFLMIKATYEPIDLNYAIEESEFIEYYYDDDPTQIRHMSKILILTGNSQHRIPQIYLNNPNETYNVNIEVLMANLAQEDITYTVATSANYSGLYYNSIISDNYIYNLPCSGSSELYIIDTSETVLSTIPYYKIFTITKQSDNVTMIIGLDTEEKISLEFVNEYNLDQANSRINWVMKNKQQRVLDLSYIYDCNVRYNGLDVTSPVMTPTSVSGWTGTTFMPYTTGTTITSTELIDYYVSGITDDRDGVISIYNTNVVVRKLDGLVPQTSITEEGQYDVEFSISDIAGNTTTHIARTIIDVTAPEIIFYAFVSGSTSFDMSIIGNTADSSGITYSDIKSYTVLDVTDNVDDTLTVGDVNILVTPTGNTYISTSGGTYTVDYSLTDFAGLTFTTGKTMAVIE